MDKLYYNIKLLSPIILSKNQGDMNSVPTSDEFSGTAIIGALASKYFKIKKTNDINVFNLWFLSGALKFHHAKILKNRNVFVNKPFSVLGKKNPKREKGKIIETDLFDTLALSQLDNDLKYKLEFVSFNEGTYSRTSISKQFNFHHKRNPKTGSSEEGIIFNYESLDAGQEFAGYISGNAKDLNDFKNCFGEKQILYFGRSRNSQYGKVEFSLYSEPIFEETLFKDSLDDKLTITFVTDTILLNDCGFPSVTQSTFESYIQSSIDKGIKIKKSFLKLDETRGYNAKWKLRRPSESCFQAGSCFLLDISECGDKQVVIQKIQKLIENGIGERTHEGFGEALLNLQIYDTISFDEEDEAKPEKPKNFIFETVDSEDKIIEKVNSFKTDYTSNKIHCRTFIIKHKNSIMLVWYNNSGKFEEMNLKKGDRLFTELDKPRAEWDNYKITEFIEEVIKEKINVLTDEVKDIIKQIYIKQFVQLAEKQALDDVKVFKRLKGTSTSIVSRLESLINEENGTLELVKNGSEVLKNTAKKTLEKVRFNNQKLYDYLLLYKDESNSPISIQSFLKKNDSQKLKKLRDDEFKEYSKNGKTFLQEEKFEKELNRQIRNSYLKFLFSILRKQIKLNNKSQGEQNE